MKHKLEATGTRGGFVGMGDVSRFIRGIVDRGIQRATRYEQQESRAYVAIARVPCKSKDDGSSECMAEKLEAAGFTGVVRCNRACRGKSKGEGTVFSDATETPTLTHNT